MFPVLFLFCSHVIRKLMAMFPEIPGRASFKIIFFVIFFNPEQLAKIKIEDDGSYVQLSEVNKLKLYIPVIK